MISSADSSAGNEQQGKLKVLVKLFQKLVRVGKGGTPLTYKKGCKKSAYPVKQDKQRVSLW